jgi:hypothetical protein
LQHSAQQPTGKKDKTLQEDLNEFDRVFVVGILMVLGMIVYLCLVVRDTNSP